MSESPTQAGMYPVPVVRSIVMIVYLNWFKESVVARYHR